MPISIPYRVTDRIGFSLSLRDVWLIIFWWL
jgi:hypothetical protein